MTDAERASQLADEIDDELNELRERFADRENDHFSFGLKFSSWDIIARALRRFAETEARPSPPTAGAMEALRVLTDAVERYQVAGPLKRIITDMVKGLDLARTVLDAAVVKARPGRACKHGIRWPWACDECDADVLANYAASPVASPPPADLRGLLIDEFDKHELSYQGQSVRLADAALAAILAAGFVILPREPTDEMVERTARALCSADSWSPDGKDFFGDIANWRNYETPARLSLRAALTLTTKEPTP